MRRSRRGRAIRTGSACSTWAQTMSVLELLLLLRRACLSGGLGVELSLHSFCCKAPAAGVGVADPNSGRSASFTRLALLSQTDGGMRIGSTVAVQSAPSHPLACQG